MFYDDRGDNRFTTTSDTHVDRRAFEPPEPGFSAEGNPPPPRDWGTRNNGFFPDLRWPSEMGPVVGGGPRWTRYGFRRFPYATHVRLTALVAPVTRRFGVEAAARILHTGGSRETRLAGRATQLSATNFFGYGNESSQITDRTLRRIFATVFDFSVELVGNAGPHVQLAIGPRVEYQRPEPETGAPALAVPGGSSFGVAGLRGWGVIDRRDSSMYPRRGVLLRAELAGYPAVWGDAPEAFVTGGATSAWYIPLPGGIEPTLALRAGAQRVWGDAPFQYAAYLGGGSTIRGYRSHRFAGETAVHGSSELRVKLGRANLLVARGELGAFGLGDVGRVFISGESSSKWHSAIGGGLWFAPLERAVVAHLQYAYGEQHRISAGLGMPF